MRRKRKASSYLNRLIDNLKKSKTKSDSSNNRKSKKDLRARPVFSDTFGFKKNEQTLKRSRQEFVGLF